jgi:hypothetical protein
MAMECDSHELIHRVKSGEWITYKPPHPLIYKPNAKQLFLHWINHFSFLRSIQTIASANNKQTKRTTAIPSLFFLPYNRLADKQDTFVFRLQRDQDIQAQTNIYATIL